MGALAGALAVLSAGVSGASVGPSAGASAGVSAGAGVGADAEEASAFKAELCETPQNTRRSYLEDIPDPGTGMMASSAAAGGRELEVALEFNPVASLRLAFEVGCHPETEQAIKNGSNAVILSGDGGPVRRSPMTVVTKTFSSELTSGPASRGTGGGVSPPPP